MTKPTFLIIGAQKAGTTNFWWMLNQHPEISMTPRKETHYFLRHTDYPDHEWYERQFTSQLDGTFPNIFGESTPSYCFWPGAIERIYEYDPDMKLIMLLRDPVRRAISQYWMEFQAGHEHLPIAAALIDLTSRQLSKFPVTWQHGYYHHSYIERGLYHLQIDRILEFFPKKQLYVELLEQFIATPSIVMEGIAQFLGLVDTQWNFPIDFDYARKKGEYPETHSGLLKYLYQIFKRPNEVLKEKYNIVIDVWKEM